MTTVVGGSGDTVQNGNLDREKENVPKNIKEETAGSTQDKLVNGVASKESVDETSGTADLKVATKNVSHLIIL